jgi:putative flippase GtrA
LSQPGRRPLAKQLASFTLVGLAGLAVDAGLFLWLTSGLYWPVALARSLSVSGSIATTWTLNRTVTFARQRSSRRGVEFARYALVQVSGLVLNIGVFALCLWMVPSLRSMPIVPLFLGCAAGYAFNFSAMRAVVFRGTSPP